MRHSFPLSYYFLMALFTKSNHITRDNAGTNRNYYKGTFWISMFYVWVCLEPLTLPHATKNRKTDVCPCGNGYLSFLRARRGGEERECRYKGSNLAIHCRRKNLELAFSYYCIFLFHISCILLQQHLAFKFDH